MVRTMSKGLTSKEYILFSILVAFQLSLLGSLAAWPKIYVDRLILAAVAALLAEGVMSHSIHDIIHGGERKTLSKKWLLTMFVAGTVVFFVIIVVLALMAGWPLLLFGVAGIILSLYAKGLLYDEKVFSTGCFLVVLASYYVQTSTVTPGILMLAAFAFMLSLGGIHVYRIDDYPNPMEEKNKGLFIIMLSMPFLIVALLLL